MARKASYIAGLDLGSTKTCTLICEPHEGAGLRVKGFGTAESKGWRKGLLVNLDAAVLAIKKAVEAAEDAAGAPIESAYVGLGGPQVRGFNSTGGMALGKSAESTREVTGEDVRKAFQTAQGVSLPADRRVVYAERQEYLLDSQNGIRNPVGMVGARLEVNVHLITASVTAHENIVAAANRAGLVVNDTIYEALAAADACLTTDERELGVALLDIGGGASNLICYHAGTIRHSAVIPVGGEHFTNDVAVGLRTPIPEAEKMKLAWGRREAGTAEDDMLEVASVGERPARQVTYRTLSDILEPRAQELIEFVQAELRRSGLENQLVAGLVLVGGGAKLGGFLPLAERVLGLPVRLGEPAGLDKMGELLPDPANATVVGLVIHGNRLRLLQASREPSWGDRLWGIFRGK